MLGLGLGLWLLWLVALVALGAAIMKMAGNASITSQKMENPSPESLNLSKSIYYLCKHIAKPICKYIMKGVYKLGAYIPRIASTSWIAPNAAVVGNVILHEHTSVWFSATIRGDNPEPIEIGARTNIQDGAVMHADKGIPLTIGSGVTIGHQAMLHGCTVGDNTLMVSGLPC